MSRHPRPAEFVLRFTPAQWHHLLGDEGFLDDPDNRCGPSRMLLGLPVEIVPDHRIQTGAATLVRQGRRRRGSGRS